MTYLGMIGYFLILYPMIAVIAGVIMEHFGISKVGANVLLLIFLVFSLIGTFVKENHRYLNKKEIRYVFFGFTAIDCIMQALGSFFVINVLRIDISIGLLVKTTATIVAVHALLIFAILASAKRGFVKKGLISDEKKGIGESE